MLTETEAKLLDPIHPLLIYYGPHACETCGRQIVKTAREQGGQAYDSPPGPIYPNSLWLPHVCAAADVAATPRRIDMTRTHTLSGVDIDDLGAVREAAVLARSLGHWRRILAIYGDHLPSCTRRRVSDFNAATCDCGWVTAFD